MNSVSSSSPDNVYDDLVFTNLKSDKTEPENPGTPSRDHILKYMISWGGPGDFSGRFPRVVETAKKK
jgi:hypothetical protein